MSLVGQLRIRNQMPQLQLKPTHKVVQDYYESLAKFAKLGIKHEGAVRSAFQTLLESCGRQFDWKLVPEYRSKTKAAAQIQVDGALLDNYGLVHGYWELDWRVEAMKLSKDKDS